MATEIIKGKALRRLIDKKHVSPKAIQLFDKTVLKLAEEVAADLHGEKGKITEMDMGLALNNRVILSGEKASSPGESEEI